MKIFSYLYNKSISLSSHRHAHYYLAGISFIESSIFPIPPDVMLISMGLATPQRSWYYALIATLFSVIGGLFGYLIGMYAMEFIQPYIIASSYAGSYYKIIHWFDLFGIWAVILAGFTPIPYKLFTITAGALQMPIMPFIVGSIIGRGMRFFLVSCLMYYTGARIADRLQKSVEIIGWALLFVIVVIFCLIKLV